jgi:hypothetical protein
MPMQSRIIFVLACTAMLCGVATGATTATESAPPPKLRQIPGITAPDAFPRGCVDCHVVQPDQKMDVRLSTLMRHWQDKVDPAFLARVRSFTPADIALKGKHPKVSIEEVPQGCLACHARDSKLAPPFDRLLHGLHLVGGEKNHFLSVFQGECTHCHKLDKATGAWSLGSGKEK